MKKLLNLLVVFVVSQISAKALTTPEAFLSQLPSVPSVACASDRTVVDKFSDRVNEVKASLKEVIDQIHEEAEVIGEDLQNNTDGKKALKTAQKDISEQYGVSMSDLEKVGEMSDAEQEKWAQNYAGKMMNQAQKDPKSAIKKGDHSARLFQLAKEQKELGETITSRMERVSAIFKSVDLQDTIESRKLEEKIKPLEKELCSGICTPAEIARSNAAEKQIYNLKIQYCEKMSPLQSNALNQYLTTLKTLIPIYRRLTEVENEIARDQFGDIVPVDLSCYSAVDEYADVLLEAYKYWVGKYEN
jgi:hypothetical protein